MISPNREPFSLQGQAGWQQAGLEVLARDRTPMYYARTLQRYGAKQSTAYVCAGPLDLLTPGLVVIVTGTGLRSCIRGAVPGFGPAPASASPRLRPSRMSWNSLLACPGCVSRKAIFSIDHHSTCLALGREIG